MARRKRSSSDSSSSATSQKRVAFEIPASLQQLSTISRSLATSTDSSRPSASQVRSQPAEPQPSSSPSQSSSIALSSFPVASRPNPRKFIIHKRSLPDAQSWPQPMTRPQSYNADATPPARLKNDSNSPAVVSVSEGTPAAVAPAHHLQLNANNAVSKAAPAPEPALKPGEAPSLTTHPNLIASLIAQKRAENEAMGFREKWAKLQAEYKKSKSAPKSTPSKTASKSPSSKTKSTPSKSASKSSTSKTASKSPTASSGPRSSRASAPDTAVPNSDVVVANRVSAPATGNSKKRKATRDSTKGLLTGDMKKANPTGDPRKQKGVHARQSTESESLLGSPVPSQVADVLEKPAHNVGRKGTSQSVSASSRPSTNNTPILQNREHQRPLPTAPAPTQIHASTEHASIPFLLSENTFGDQSHSRSQNPMSQIGQVPPYSNSPDVVQQHAYARASISRQNSQSQLKAYGSQAQLSSQTPVMGSNAYFARSPSMSGYYKMDMQGNFYNSDPSPTTQAGTNRFDAAEVYGRSSTPMGMTYSGHLGHNPNAYMVNMPRPTGTLPSYGAPMAPTTEQPKMQSSNTNMMMRAGDLVAGTNTKFNGSTNDGFVVPKRF
ncbi:uncharacterized protein PV06_10694 [Exophiala oligosperma]|uniref:Uncharacterized protein n=1 Tax=Exophiala oligosperma TaxID=215243 RepID=A0A0D2D428_9EURO|nr:uncharacterized protein PV06_10694 [Exophiala oligosperma]KIW37065.1 hypothetical protein PV06_10694 [Exophiala oligosperma]